MNQDYTYALVRRRDSGDLLITLHPLLTKCEDVLGKHDILAVIPGAALLGSRYRPLFGPPGRDSLPIIHARHVRDDSGTGLVHTAPGHGVDDYRALPGADVLSPVDAAGCFTSEVAQLWVGADALVGHDVLGTGNREIVRMLQEAGHLLHQERITHSYPYDWRTKNPIIVTFVLCITGSAID